MPKIPKRRDAPDAFRLIQEIVVRSEADGWDRARLEWTLVEVFTSEELGTCLCSHYPIRAHCVLENQHNGNRVVVGNCCVKRFLGLPSGKLFSGLNRVAADPERSLNSEGIDFAHHKGWINDWEQGFLQKMMRKQKLTPRQRAKRAEINRMVIARLGESSHG